MEDAMKILMVFAGEYYYPSPAAEDFITIIEDESKLLDVLNRCTSEYLQYAQLCELDTEANFMRPLSYWNKNDVSSEWREHYHNTYFSREKYGYATLG